MCGNLFFFETFVNNCSATSELLVEPPAVLTNTSTASNNSTSTPPKINLDSCTQTNIPPEIGPQRDASTAREKDLAEQQKSLETIYEMSERRTAVEERAARAIAISEDKTAIAEELAAIATEKAMISQEKTVKAEEDAILWKAKSEALANNTGSLGNWFQDLSKRLLESVQVASRAGEEANMWKAKYGVLEKKMCDGPAS